MSDLELTDWCIGILIFSLLIWFLVKAERKYSNDYEGYWLIATLMIFNIGIIIGVVVEMT